MRRLSWMLFGGGVLLLMQGLSSFYWSVFPEVEVAAVSVSTTPLIPASIPKLQRGSLVCRISFPSLDADFPVAEGVDAAVLKHSPGHMPSSVVPGARGNAVIAAHRDTHFRLLKQLAPGDPIRIDRQGIQSEYRVTEIRVVEPTDLTPLRPSQQATLTLITCYPFQWVGPAPRRYIVRATAVTPPLADSRLTAQSTIRSTIR